MNLNELQIYERNERISLDAAWNDFKVSLTDEERSFITLTVQASGEENAKLVQSHYAGKAKEDPLLGSYSLSKELNDNERTAWASLYYQLTYHISDDTLVTIGERDRILSDVIRGIQNYWDTTDIDTLLSMDSNELEELLNAILSRYSNDLVEVSFSENNFQLISQSEPKM